MKINQLSMCVRVNKNLIIIHLLSVYAMYVHLHDILRLLDKRYMYLYYIMSKCTKKVWKHKMILIKIFILLICISNREYK